MSRRDKSAARQRISFVHRCVVFVWCVVCALEFGEGQVVALPLASLEFRVAVSSPPKTLDPLLAGDAAAGRILQLTHPALINMAPDGNPKGNVARSCAQSKPAEVVCYLKQQVFTDGTPLNAPAIAQWFEIIQKTPRSPLSGPLEGVKMTAPDATTLVFTLPSPTLAFMDTLAQTPLANPAHTSAGAGPYRIVGQDELGTVSLETNQPGLMSKLSFVPVGDPSTRLLKLKKGEVEAVLNDISPELVRWAQKEGLSVVAAPGTSYTYIGLNLTSPVLAVADVREALMLGLNRPAFRRALLGGLASVADTLLPPAHRAAWAVPEDPYDPFTAENMLDEAGYVRGPDNTRFTLTLLTSTDPLSQRVGQAIQAQWAAIGVHVVLRPTEWASFFAGVQKGDFDAVLLAWTGDQNPEFYYQLFHSSQFPPKLNRGRVNDPTLDALAMAIHTAPTEEARTAATVAIQKELARFRPTIPLYRRFNILITRPGVTGCTLPSAGDYRGLVTCRMPPAAP